MDHIVPEEVTQKLIDSVLTEFTFNYQQPQVMDSSDYVLILNTKKSCRYSSGKSNWQDDDYWNTIFFNKKPGTTSLFAESKMKISSFSPSLRDQGDVQKIVFYIKSLTMSITKIKNCKVLIQSIYSYLTLTLVL